jgi:hypothetical protein
MKQYKKGLKAGDSILKKFPEHGGMLKELYLFSYHLCIILVLFQNILL